MRDEDGGAKCTTGGDHLFRRLRKLGLWGDLGYSLIPVGMGRFLDTATDYGQRTGANCCCLCYMGKSMENEERAGNV